MHKKLLLVLLNFEESASKSTIINHINIEELFYEMEFIKDFELQQTTKIGAIKLFVDNYYAIMYNELLKRAEIVLSMKIDELNVEIL